MHGEVECSPVDLVKNGPWDGEIVVFMQPVADGQT